MLTSQRLELWAAEPVLYHLDMVGPGPLGRELEACVPHSWPPPELGPVRRELALLAQKRPQSQGWFAWYLVLQDTMRSLCGVAGFNGPPSEAGVVELGYSILPEFQGRGVATEAAEALAAWASAQPGVEVVAAVPRAGSDATTRVLEKLGCIPAPREIDPDLPLGAWICRRQTLDL